MVKLEKIDENKVALEIEVDEETLAKAFDQAYRKVVKKISLPGFRKGKVPRVVLESRFGPEILYEDAIEIMVPPAYEQAVKETGIEPIDQPAIDLVQLEKGKPFIFKATVEVKPEVKLGEYRGLEVTRQVREITDEDVEKRLQQIREQHVKLHVVEDRALEMGDVAVIDFTGFIDGEPFDGGQGEGYSLEIGSNTFIPGFEPQLVGMKIGEEKEIAVTFPEDYHVQEVAGKDAIFKVKLNEIKSKEIPELTDEFVQEISEFETVAELKEDVMNKLKEQEEERADSEVKIKLVDAITEASEVKVPEILIENQIDIMVADLERFLRMQGLTLEKFLELGKKTMEELRQEQREDAEKLVKRDLVLDAIRKKEGIEATDEELQERIKTLAENYNQEEHVIKELLTAQGQLDVMRHEITYGKVIDFLVGEAKITTEIVSAVEKEEQEG
ncbi:MAG: trigger factor [Firmicutes bacterium]|nr:trigger factor [Bacillota bacterium]